MVRIEIYTRASCQFCFAAKRLLAMHGLEYEEYSLDREPARLQEMLERTHNRSVPQVLADGVPLGGFREMAEMSRSGELAGLADTD